MVMKEITGRRLNMYLFLIFFFSLLDSFFDAISLSL